jgi:hypothetical protein
MLHEGIRKYGKNPEYLLHETGWTDFGHCDTEKFSISLLGIKTQLFSP